MQQLESSRVSAHGTFRYAEVCGKLTARSGRRVVSGTVCILVHGFTEGM